MHSTYSDGQDTLEAMVAAFDSGRFTLARLDSSVIRILDQYRNPVRGAVVTFTNGGEFTVPVIPQHAPVTDGLIGIAGHEDHLEVGARLQQSLGERRPPHRRHDDVGDQHDEDPRDVLRAGRALPLVATHLRAECAGGLTTRRLTAP